MSNSCRRIYCIGTHTLSISGKGPPQDYRYYLVVDHSQNSADCDMAVCVVLLQVCIRCIALVFALLDTRVYTVSQFHSVFDRKAISPLTTSKY